MKGLPVLIGWIDEVKAQVTERIDAILFTIESHCQSQAVSFAVAMHICD
jgi:hypothetical protein